MSWTALPIAAALLIAPTGQPATGQPNTSATPGDAFAALLDAATSPDANGASAAAAPSPQSFPTQPPLLQLQLDVREGLVPIVPVATAADATTDQTTEAAVASSGLATTPAAKAAVPAASANAPAEQAAAETPAPVVAEPSPDAIAPAITPTPSPATPVAAAATPAAAIQAAQPAATSEPSTLDNERETDGEEGAGAATTSSAQPAPVVSAVAVIPTIAAPATQAAADPVAGNAVTIETPLEPMTETNAASVETPEPVAGGYNAASTSAPSRATAQPTAAAQASTAAPANEAVAAKPDIAALVAAQPARAADASTATTQLAETARAPTTPQALQSAPAATVQVYSRIIERADGRSQRFEIRLDPAELGRVDVRIEIGADRKVHAVLAAHDSAALSDLMRGQRALERALSDAGIDLADKGVRFELASDNGAASQQRDSEGHRNAQANVWRRFETMTMPVTEDIAAAVSQPSWRPQRLDLVA